MTTSNALNYYRDLIKSGVPEQQAYDQTAALDRALEHLSTKEDLSSVRTELKNEMGKNFAILDAKIDMTQKWGLSLLIAIFVMVLKISLWDIPKFVVNGTRDRGAVMQKKETPQMPTPTPKPNKGSKSKEQQLKTNDIQ